MSAVQKSYQLRQRLTSEPLFREIIFVTLTESGSFGDKDTLIDIGSWIGDNALPWAALLPDGASVFAVDPDRRNIAFINRLSVLNGLGTRVVALAAVCSDAVGRQLFYSGPLNHATFSSINTGLEAPDVSSTLDVLVKLHPRCQRVAFMHIDVENMEFEVLQGAVRIISQDRPLIVFEQHISHLDSRIFSLLGMYYYNIYMINEVIKGNLPDCRNFFAIPDALADALVTRIESRNRRVSEVYPAAVGPSLIRVG